MRYVPVEEWPGFQEAPVSLGLHGSIESWELADGEEARSESVSRRRRLVLVYGTRYVKRLSTYKFPTCTLVLVLRSLKFLWAGLVDSLIT
jgi:hypothetical protein